MPKNKLITVGITGPTGSGKSSLRRMLCQYRCHIIDCDACAREITLPGAPALAELSHAFGSDILAADGSLIRPLLAERAFGDSYGRQRLNEITHPHIRTLTEDYIHAAHQRGYHAAVDAPLLFESGFDELCDVTVALVAPWDIRKKRIMVRDGISSEAAELRMSAQQEDEYYTSRADYTIVNDGSAQELDRRGREVFDEIFGKRADIQA